MARDADSIRPSLDAPEGAGWVELEVAGRRLFVWGWDSIPEGSVKTALDLTAQPLQPLQKPA